MAEIQTITMIGPGGQVVFNKADEASARLKGYVTLEEAAAKKAPAPAKKAPAKKKFGKKSFDKSED
jgi:hypothetical protein